MSKLEALRGASLRDSIHSMIVQNGTKYVSLNIKELQFSQAPKKMFSDDQGQSVFGLNYFFSDLKKHCVFEL